MATLWGSAWSFVQFSVDLFQLRERSGLAADVLRRFATGSRALLDVCKLREQRIAPRDEPTVLLARPGRAGQRQPETQQRDGEGYAEGDVARERAVHRQPGHLHAKHSTGR